MNHEILEQLGLSKNESRIYETLLRENSRQERAGLSSGDIATKSKVHRRNVYDALDRLAGAGLVFVSWESRENRYQPAPPEKLKELLGAKQQKLTAALPDLQALYEATPHTDETYIYKGIEGWQNYLRESTRLGGDFYVFGLKNDGDDPSVSRFLEQFNREAKKKGVAFYHAPKALALAAPIEVFADRVVFTKYGASGCLDAETSFTIVVNQQVADSFRALFGFLGARKNV